jgi:glutamyl-Q tRNA(Asp) synthetase
VIQRGRFAPSPTGPLHMGSLTTALASWLDARAGGGQWFVRIEDIDTPRESPGASDLIMRQLQAHGLHWDKWIDPDTDDSGVLFQHRRTEVYRRALLQLIGLGLAYPCTCSRKKLQFAIELGKTRYNPDGEILYPGYCTPAQTQHCSAQQALEILNAHNGEGIAWRFRNKDRDDFVLKRADGFWAYQLAVVVDDAHQGITKIIRGDDLYHATPRQTALRRALGHPEPSVLHVPVVKNEQGEKLSKQTKAMPLRTDNAATIALQLECAWSHLELTMPARWIERVRAAYLRLLRQPKTVF